jgi:hypothetical protein
MKIEYESDEARRIQSKNTNFADSIGNIFKRLFSFFGRNDGNHIGYATQYQIPSALL